MTIHQTLMTQLFISPFVVDLRELARILASNVIERLGLLGLGLVRQKSEAEPVESKVIESLWFMTEEERTKDQQAILEITATDYLQEQIDVYNGRRSKFSPQLRLQIIGDTTTTPIQKKNLPSQIQRQVDHCNKVYFKDQKLRLVFDQPADGLNTR